VPWNDTARWKEAVARDRDTSWDFEDVRDHYLRVLYGEDPQRLRAGDWPHYLRLSRAVSADVMQATIAEWRRAGSGCAGALVWMFKDFAPGAGWGVVDSNSLPKTAWHGLRRAFQPVRASLTDEGLNGLGLHLINETATARPARLVLLCLQGGETVALRREREIELPALSNRTLSSAELIGSFFDITYAYRFGPPPLDCAIIMLVDPATGARLSEALHFPLGRAALAHASGLTAETVADGAGWALRLKTTRLAPAVQIEDANYRAADEGFALLPGEERLVKLIAVSRSDARPSGAVFTGLGRDIIRY
jgi:beta-mannosidase